MSGNYINGRKRKLDPKDNFTSNIQELDKNITGAKLQLHSERLNIAKKLIQTGEVTVHKEILTEEKTITVPVTREELVIEKRALDGDIPGKSRGHFDTIRIPLSEERIEIIKRPVVLQEVSVNKRRLRKYKHIEETIRKEKLHIKTVRNPLIIDNTEDKD